MTDVSTLSNPSPVKRGDVVAGKYRVEEILGVGGMGVVVAATHIGLDQRVALKFLLPQGTANADVSARFAREARAAAKIHSDHVAKVIDVGTLPDGAPYMVMEYLDGEDLQAVLSRKGPLPFDVATGYVLEACEAVAEAHAMGIVHRDLKPANLFLAKRRSGTPIVKVLDFGISKSTLSTAQAHLTKTSAVMGSPLYMSPEQMASSKSVDVRSDVWALGVVLYELLAGKLPFTADTMPELVVAVMQRPHEPLDSVRSDVPAGFEAVVARCLEKDASKRYANIGELARALLPFGPAGSQTSVDRIEHVSGLDAVALASRRGSSLLAHETQPSQAEATAAQAMTHAPWSQSSAYAATTLAAAPRRGRVIGIAVAVAVLVLGGAGAFLLHTKGAEVAALQATSVTPAVSGGAGGAVASATATPPPVASTETVAASAASSAPAAVTTAVSPPSTGVPVVTAQPAIAPPLAHPKARAVTTAAPAAPKCRVISTPDSNGDMHFKQVCP